MLLSFIHLAVTAVITLLYFTTAHSQIHLHNINK